MVAARRPLPRLVTWLTGLSFLVIAGVLGVGMLLLSWQTETSLAAVAAQDLERSQRWFADVEAQRGRERRLQAVVLSENPTLKAAVDTYVTETAQGTPAANLLPTVSHEVNKLADVLGTPALAVADRRGRILASAGPLAPDWRPGRVVAEVVSGARDETVVVRDDRLYLATSVPLQLGADTIGVVVSAIPLDDAFAQRLGKGASADVVVVHNGRVAASSSPVLSALTPLAWPASGTVDAGGRRLVVRRLTAVDDTAVYAASAVDGATAAALAGMSRVIAGAALVALLLAASGSWWLARVLARPVATLTESVARMAETRDLHAPLPRGGAVREIDALADSFDALRAAVVQAEEDSDAAYAGVIAALAAALDARDPYTAGHSQRVAMLAVFIAEEMRVPVEERETLRLGALLHDVGKIGVNDAVLRKPGRLTPEEMDHIRLHPVLGARILQPVAFLAPHLHIVELHHERPDGRGYPHGLVGDAIPLFARIVHVADAFDAMTSARAYRSARPPADAVAELRKNMGTDFDADVVAAMLVVWQQRLAASGGVIAVDRLPFRDPAEFGAAARVRATLREARPVA